MAQVNLSKATTLQNQAMLSLFTMPTNEGLSDLAKEYLNLYRDKEMKRLKWQIGVKSMAAD